MNQRERRVLGVLGLVVVPWVVLPFSGGISAVMLWGLVRLDTFHVTDIVSYVFVYTSGLPTYLVFWPISVVVYCTAVLSVTGLYSGNEDPRVTSGLLGIAGACVFVIAVGLLDRGSLAVPVGAIGLWAVAWWLYTSQNETST